MTVVDKHTEETILACLDDIIVSVIAGYAPNVIASILEETLNSVLEIIGPSHPPDVLSTVEHLVAYTVAWSAAAADPEVVAHAVSTALHEVRRCAIKHKDPTTGIENDAGESYFENLPELVQAACELGLDCILTDAVNEIIRNIPLTARAKELEKMTEPQRRLRYHKSMSVTPHEDDHDHLHRMLTTKKNYLYMVVQLDFRVCKIGVTKASEIGLLKRYGNIYGTIHEHLHVQITNGKPLVSH